MITNCPSASERYVLSYKKKLHKLIQGLIQGKAKVRILDVGCGRGEDLLSLSLLGDFFLCGLDISQERLDKAQAMTSGRKGIFLVRACAQNLPFKDKAFDVVLASEIIEHIDNPNNFLQQLKRVLVADGHLFITTPPPYSYTTIIGKLIPEGRLKIKLRKFIYFRHSPMDGIKRLLPDGTIVKEHVREFTPRQLKRILVNSGFKVLGIFPGDLRPFFFPLFDRLPFLLRLWRGLDKMIDLLPGGMNIKANFIVMAKNEI